MVNSDNIVEMDMDMLIMFKCPSFSSSGLMCVFASMKDNMGSKDSKKGLKCRELACEIRIPTKK
jgi:hypothetical protein